jgi:hypothetical protein
MSASDAAQGLKLDDTSDGQLTRNASFLNADESSFLGELQEAAGDTIDSNEVIMIPPTRPLVPISHGGGAHNQSLDAAQRKKMLANNKYNKVTPATSSSSSSSSSSSPRGRAFQQAEDDDDAFDPEPKKRRVKKNSSAEAAAAYKIERRFSSTHH